MEICDQLRRNSVLPGIISTLGEGCAPTEVQQQPFPCNPSSPLPLLCPIYGSLQLPRAVTL